MDPLPAQPTEWPVERKLPSADVDISLDLIKNLKPVFESIVGDVKQIEGMPLLAQVSSFLAKINKELSGVKAIEEYEPWYDYCFQLNCFRIYEIIASHLSSHIYDQYAVDSIFRAKLMPLSTTSPFKTKMATGTQL